MSETETSEIPNFEIAHAPEEFRENQTVAGLDGKPVSEVIKALVGAEKLIGHPTERVIIRPGEDASDEERKQAWTRFHGEQAYGDWKIDAEALGIEGLDGNMISDDLVGGFREIGESLGLTTAQMTGLAKWQLEAAMGQQKSGQDALTAQIDAGARALKAELGAAHDELMAGGKQLLSEYGDKGEDGTNQTEAFFKGLGIHEHPIVTGLLARLAQNFQEGSGIPGSKASGTGGGGAALTPAQIGAKLGEVETKLNVMEKTDPDYKTLLGQREELLKQQGEARNG